MRSLRRVEEGGGVASRAQLAFGQINVCTGRVCLCLCVSVWGGLTALVKRPLRWWVVVVLMARYVLPEEGFWNRWSVGL